MCGKSPIAAVSGAGAVGGYYPEMVRGARTQPADVRADVLCCVATKAISGGARPVASGKPVLKMDGCDCPVRINRTVERGCGAGYISCSSSCDNGRHGGR